MLTKLTLTVDRTVVERAKKYAQERKKSVSRIVEEYLRNLLESDKDFVFESPINAPITDSMVGMFSDNGKDYKEMLEEARTERLQ